MPKRRRLFTPLKNKAKTTPIKSSSSENKAEHHEVKESPRPKGMSTARDRLQGALLDAMEPPVEDSQSDTSSDQEKNFDSDDDAPQTRYTRQRQSYVLKLFDRSVDLSQFDEDSPLYPICRAWIVNKPKADYSEIRKQMEPELHFEGCVDLPGPEGPPISRIPDLLPEQIAANKNNINLNYREAPPPSKEQLLWDHITRWTAVRRAWLTQGSRVEARYDSTQQCLNKMSASII